MKIQGTIPLQSVQSTRPRATMAAATRSEGSDQVQLSDDARFIQSLRDTAEAMPGFRQDAVDQARADIASGRLGSEEDLDATVDALLAGF